MFLVLQNRFFNLVKYIKQSYYEYFVCKIIIISLIFIAFFFINLIMSDIAEQVSALIIISIILSLFYFCDIMVVIEDKELFLLSEKISFFFLIITITIGFIMYYILYIRPILYNSYVWAVEKIISIFFLNSVLLINVTCIYFLYYYFNKLFELQEKIKDIVDLNITFEGFGLYLYDFKFLDYIVIVGICSSIFILCFIFKAVVLVFRFFIMVLLIFILPISLSMFNIKFDNFGFILIFVCTIELIIFLVILADFDFFNFKK